MLLLVGLGNPGPEYAGNRHNIGYMAADAIVRRHGFGPWRVRFHGLVADGQLAGDKALVFKPTTYMNLSGQAVGEIARFYKIPLERIIVIHDDLDLVPGKIRVKRGGGGAGHNGIASVDDHLGPDYWRVRVGIGHPGARHLVHRYVLSNFFKEERPLFEKLIEAIAEAAPLLSEDDGGRFMNKVSLLVNPPQPKPKREDAAPTDGESDGADGV